MSDIYKEMAAKVLNKPAELVTEQERKNYGTRLYLLMYGGFCAGDLHNTYSTPKNK